MGTETYTNFDSDEDKDRDRDTDRNSDRETITNTVKDSDRDMDNDSHTNIVMDKRPARNFCERVWYYTEICSEGYDVLN
jgi:hypothetical protein